MAPYLGVERSPGLHFREQVGERVELLVEARLLLHQSLRQRDDTDLMHTHTEIAAKNKGQGELGVIPHF